MSALDGFYSTWSQARETFGSGVPRDGAEFDRGTGELRRLQSSIEAAKPDSRWQGAAADSYAVKNEQHAATYGKLADLDQRMSAELNRSAGVVTAGRQSLDQIHSWATSAAAAAPAGPSGEKMKTIIANKGIGQITEVITQANAQMAAIGDRVRDLDREYQEISGEHDASDVELVGLKDAQGRELPGTTLDLNDIKQLSPGQPGPRGYMELVPNSGTWVPDPKSPEFVPHPPVSPVDLDDIVYKAPGELGPYAYTELVPDSGVWVPDPEKIRHNSAEYEPDPPTRPFDLAEIQRTAPGGLGPRGYQELVPDSGVWVPRNDTPFS